uniref:Uncharacterized protein n=1 Tax=Arundo donax TaxID=35708 RepID=A0A0A9H7Q1_ARUDO
MPPKSLTGAYSTYEVKNNQLQITELISRKRIVKWKLDN